MIAAVLIHGFHAALAYLAIHAGGIHCANGILGGSSKTDRQNTLAGYGDLNNLFNVGLTGGTAATGAAQSYNESLLSGNRSQISQALSPEISAITGQANQNKKQQAAMGTSRGGGTNALNQQQDQNTQAQISQTINQARPAAAQQLASIGSNLLGLGSDAAQGLTKDAITSYQTTSAQNAANGQAAGQLAAGLIFGA